jgi:regulatory protein
MLAAQPRTRAELERSLSRAGAPDEVVSRVLDRFAELRLVDDAAYAQAYVRTGVGVRRRGTRSLTMELRGRGVAPEDIESATAEIDEAQEHATARALASRRVAGMGRLDPQVRRRRLIGLLLRRGFSPGLANAVVSEVLAEVAGAAEEITDDFADDDFLDGS